MASLTWDQIVAILCFGTIGLGVGLLTMVEVLRWRQRHSVITRHQIVVRVIGGIVLLLLLSKVLGGVLYVSPDRHPIRVVLNYWAECVALGWLMIVIAAVDLRMVMKTRRQHRRSMAEMAQQIMDSFRAEHAPGEPLGQESNRD